MPFSKSERSYTETSLLSSPPVRNDGRSLLDFRTITLATSVAPGTNGSARVELGGTDVLVGIKLEVGKRGEEDDDDDDGEVVVVVECSPSAFPNHDPASLSDLSTSLTTLLSSLLTPLLASHPSLSIIPPPTLLRWVPHISAIVLADAGNVTDVLVLAARAALWDLRVPRTRELVFRAPGVEEETRVLDQIRVTAPPSRHGAIDFELVDTADSGHPLSNLPDLPVCLTLNILPPVYFLDAASDEEDIAPAQVMLHVRPVSRTLCGMSKLGSGSIPPTQLRKAIRDGIEHAVKLGEAVNGRLKDPATTSAGSNLGTFG